MKKHTKKRTRKLDFKPVPVTPQDILSLCQTMLAEVRGVEKWSIVADAQNGELLKQMSAMRELVEKRLVGMENCWTALNGNIQNEYFRVTRLLTAACNRADVSYARADKAEATAEKLIKYTTQQEAKIMRLEHALRNAAGDTVLKIASAPDGQPLAIDAPPPAFAFSTGDIQS